MLNGHSDEEVRTVRYDGSWATLTGHFAYGRKHFIEIRDHLTGQTERINATPSNDGHHGEEDAGVMASFIQAVRGQTTALTAVQESLDSYLMAFTAEEARLTGTVVDMTSFRSRVQEDD